MDSTNAASRADLDAIADAMDCMGDVILRYERRLFLKWRQPDADLAIAAAKKMRRARAALARLRSEAKIHA